MLCAFLLGVALQAAPDDRSDLAKLDVQRAWFGRPVQAVDLQGKVVLWRSWSG